MREREIFIEARALGDLSERAMFLEQACGNDLELRQRVERLLAADTSPESLLERLDAAAETEPIGEKPGDQIGPYRLLNIIGEGGFGVVFHAQQDQPIRRDVALKVIRPGMDSRQIVSRFAAERQALAVMDHPNIAKVLEASTTNSGRPYFVMELVRGEPIIGYCQKKSLALRQRLELFIELCHAIGHAHSKGIIHRDIKPSNVLVTVLNNRATVKVIDFGVAKAISSQWSERSMQTAMGSVVGSLEYMSPEQANLNPWDIDTRSDIYSLGALLYELLTGTPPLDSTQLRRVGLLEALRLVREQEPQRPSYRMKCAEMSQSAASVPGAKIDFSSSSIRGDLDWITLKSIDKNRNRRYQSALDLGEEVQRYLHGKPVLAHPPSTLYYVRKHLLRNYRAWILTAMSLTLIGWFAFWQWNARLQQAQQNLVHVQRVQLALGNASAMLVAAEESTIGQSAPWTAARAAVGRLQELMEIHPVDAPTDSSVALFLANFQQRDRSRRLAEQIEQVVMMSATQPDLSNWEQMDEQFQELFLHEGIDPERQSPQEVATAIRTHVSAVPLTDALELWIGTKGQISALGGVKATAANMQPMAEAMLAADSDPVRSGIRKLLYSGKRFSGADVDAVIAGQDLGNQSPRTLSWLATMYHSAGASDLADAIFYRALDQFPDDFMLNFDFAYTLENQQRWPEAIRYFLRCTALRPEVAGVWRALGNAYQQNGELSRATEALTKAARLAPRHWPTQIDLGKLLVQQGQYLEAETLLAQASKNDCDVPALFLTLAEAYFQLKRFEDALIAITNCEACNQKQPRLAVDPSELKIKCQQAIDQQSPKP
ncbi:MAG: protein kinase [Planctomycetaceae bacterium]|nr:protein kinase [Planctomycetaceae bacterium]